MNTNSINTSSSESISPATQFTGKNHHSLHNQMDYFESNKAVVCDALANNNRQLLLANLYHYFIECKNFKTAISLLKESDVPLSISNEHINQPEALLISSQEKKNNQNLDTFIIEHNSIEIELFENQYIRSKSSMPRDGSFMVQWWDCLWSIYNNVNSQPLELLSSVRPFIDVIKPIFPEHIPVNNTGSPIHPPNLDVSSMNITRPDMYTNSNLLKSEYPNASPQSTPYMKNNENQQYNENPDLKNFTPSSQNLNVPLSSGKTFNKPNQKPSLHHVPSQAKRGSVTSQYSSPHNMNNMQYNHPSAQQYVSGIPSANTEIKKNIVHQDPKFYPQDGTFRAPSLQKSSMSANQVPQGDHSGSIYTGFGSGQRIPDEYLKPTNATHPPKNVPFQAGMMNANSVFNDMHMGNFTVPGDIQSNNLPMIHKYQQPMGHLRGNSQKYSASNTPSSNIASSVYGPTGNKTPQPQGLPQVANTQYFMGVNENVRMDKMQPPLSNIHEEREHQNVGQTSDWNYKNNTMRNSNVEASVHNGEFMDMNSNYMNGMNFQYASNIPGGGEMNPSTKNVSGTQSSLDMYNNLRVSTEVDNTSMIKKKPSGKPKGRPKKNGGKIEKGMESGGKKPTKPKKQTTTTTSTKTSSILGKNVYLEDLGDTGIVFQKERKSLNNAGTEEVPHPFSESGYMEGDDAVGKAEDSGTSIKFFGHDNLKDIYTMVSDEDMTKKTKKSGVDALIHDENFEMNFPPLRNTSSKLISEEGHNDDLLSSFLMHDMAGKEHKEEKTKSEFENDLNFNLTDQE
ncbi:uncharacterized protein HGUI_02468 [Hanseniaspora guilliermondii]|uniref:Uncharacterized protein n=1 Tax=Hanseniaspora guilliermondii TaxID=56406 RepID=A0A1L0B392_9ASCO|nr:uncharacterized protein HGUI_02468 [Hanseniaspora guilliermondii]